MWFLLTLLGLFLAIFVVEFLVLYASTALGNVDVNFSKWLVGSFVASILWAGIAWAGWALINRSGSPLDPQNRVTLVGVSAGALALSWIVLAFAFVPVFPVSISRGMLVSLFQVLLRLFLYALIGAVVMVVLAVLQLRYGPAEKTSRAPAPLTKAA